MKKTLHTLLSVTLLILVSSCAKNNDDFQSTANIYTINAAVGAGAVKINPGASSGFTYARADALAFGAMALYGNFQGNKKFTIVNAIDTTKTLLISNLNLQKINSLYIVGQSPSIDTIFRVENNFPYIQSAVLAPDSSAYIRFVNLSPNSSPINVNIKSNLTNEATNLGYKGISEFKKYKTLGATPNYLFEFRDAASKAVLATHTLTASSSRFKTIAIVIKGLRGTTTGTDAFGVFQVNYN